MEHLKAIEGVGLIPVITISNADSAVPLINALLAGGLNAVEITLRTDAAINAIKQITEHAPEIIVCAGTVLSPQQAATAKAAGAKFIVSPGLNPRVVSYCLDNNLPIIPGVITPSEIEAAIDFGLNAVKFFPAEQSGGLDYIKAVSAPYPTVRFVPTGGINLSNITKYTACPKVLAVGASWVAEKSLIDGGNFSEITRRCNEAVCAIKRTHL